MSLSQHTNSSFVTVSTSTARDLAQAKLIYITRKREALRAAFLKREVELANKPTFWKKLFRTKPVTEEDIIAREESAEYLIENSLWLIGETFSDLEDLCFAVQSACRITNGTTISLTLQDAERLQ